MKHAKLSPSSAERWIHCPASVKLSENVPERRSVYADEGTLAHELARYKLEKDFPGAPDTLDKIKANPLYSEEMDRYTTEYVETVEEVMAQFNEPYWGLFEMSIDLSSVAPETFGTIDCLLLGGDTLVVIDFKYGQNVWVSAHNNPQLKLYAYGAMEWINNIRKEDEGEIKRIYVCISQPRIGNTSYEELSPQELRLWIRDIKKKAKEALEGNSEPVPGKWCRFCPAIAICKNCAKRYDLKIAPDDPRTLSYSEISELISKLDSAAKYLKKLKDFALSEAKAGKNIPGYKVVPGRSNRTWENESKVLNKAKENNIEALEKQKLLSPAKLEKAIGRKEFTKLFSDFVIKPKGKPTLAPMEDKREEWTEN